MIRVYFPILIFLFSCNATAEIIEKWICSDPFEASTAWKTIVTAEVRGKDFGVINVANVSHKAHYQVNGFDRRWDFELTTDGTYNYAFVIAPNGNGAYYDFSRASNDEVVKPSHFLKCKQSK